MSEPTGVGYFRRLVMASVSMPSSSARDELHARIARLQPEDLPEMIEVVCEAERRCLRRLGELHRRTRAERERSAADASEWARKVQLVVIQGEVVEWDARIRWLQDMRRFLERESQGSEVSCAPAR